MIPGRGTVAARENILARIRKAQGRPGTEPTGAELALAREAIARHEVGPQPAFAHAPDRLAQFRKECDRQSTTHATVASERDIPDEVARYLGSLGLERRVAGWREFAGLDWAGRAWPSTTARPPGTTRPGSRGASAPSRRPARRCCFPRRRRRRSPRSCPRRTSASCAPRASSTRWRSPSRSFAPRWASRRARYSSSPARPGPPTSSRRSSSAPTAPTESTSSCCPT